MNTVRQIRSCHARHRYPNQLLPRGDPLLNQRLNARVVRIDVGLGEGEGDEARYEDRGIGRGCEDLVDELREASWSVGDVLAYHIVRACHQGDDLAQQ